MNRCPSSFRHPHSDKVRYRFRCRAVFLKPRRGPFSGEPARWSFTLGATTINNVRIKDENFLARYDRGDIRLNQSDLLRARLLTRQKVAGGKLDASHEILEVLEYIPGLAKSRFFRRIRTDAGISDHVWSAEKIAGLAD